jgi:nucleoside recognition membrane protein YjiH
MIYQNDWQRIRANVERLGEPLIDHALTWAATAVGAGIGLVATVVSLLATGSQVAPGVVPSFLVAVLFSAVFAICFSLVGQAAKKRHRISVATVCEDMDRVVPPERLSPSVARDQAGSSPRPST